MLLKVWKDFLKVVIVSESSAVVFRKSYVTLIGFTQTFTVFKILLCKYLY